MGALERHCEAQRSVDHSNSSSQSIVFLATLLLGQDTLINGLLSKLPVIEVPTYFRTASASSLVRLRANTGLQTRIERADLPAEHAG